MSQSEDGPPNWWHSLHLERDDLPPWEDLKLEDQIQLQPKAGDRLPVMLWFYHAPGHETPYWCVAQCEQPDGEIVGRVDGGVSVEDAMKGLKPAIDAMSQGEGPPPGLQSLHRS